VKASLRRPLAGRDVRAEDPSPGVHVQVAPWFWYEQTAIAQRGQEGTG